jgi:hypothetical protein
MRMGHNMEINNNTHCQGRNPHPQTVLYHKFLDRAPQNRLHTWGQFVGSVSDVSSENQDTQQKIETTTQQETAPIAVAAVSRQTHEGVWTKGKGEKKRKNWREEENKRDGDRQDMREVGG